jgi:uncharacterized repeat protein (TIGR03803 family)
MLSFPASPRFARLPAFFAAILFLRGLVLVTPSFASTPTEKVLYSFQGGDDGASPVSDLIADSAGNLYGTTMYGGPATCTDSVGIVIGCGTVFELVKPKSSKDDWTEIVLYSFTGPNDYSGDTGYPMAGLVMDKSGNLYGTTFGNTGYGDLGTVFELSPPAASGQAWTKTTVYSFMGGADGQNPRAGLYLSDAGDLYGSTSTGAPYNGGTVFKLTPPSGTGGSWTETVLYAFGGGDDGANPAAVVFDTKGNIYGTTSQGGGFSVGGDVYNNTWSGGGTIFKLTPAGKGKLWTETQLFAFPPCDIYGEASGGYCGTSDLPMAKLIFDAQGNLYGTSEFGLFYNPFCYRVCPGPGTVFQLAPPTTVGGAWTQNILYAFDATTTADGELPLGKLVFDTAGNLYGTTAGGCAVGNYSWAPECTTSNGSVFELSPPTSAGGTWTETTYLLQGGNDGAGAAAGMLKSGSSFYATTEYGGTGNCPRTVEQPTGCGTVVEVTF